MNMNLGKGMEGDIVKGMVKEWGQKEEAWGRE